VKIIIKLFVLFSLCHSLLFSQELEKVSIQLLWKDQFQFAGYYIAKEKGYYRDVGLDVELKKFDFKKNIVDDVLHKKTTYAIGRSSLVADRSSGKNVVLLAAILQSSPIVLVTKDASAIAQIEDFKGKKIAVTGTDFEVSIFALLNSRKISLGAMQVSNNVNKMQSLIDGDVDIISAYRTNQVYSLRKKGLNINVFNPKDYGFNFYSDILYTSKNEIKKHRQRAIYFTQASLKGWEYAFSHIEETVEMIMKKYNTQNKSKEALLYEANELKKLAYFNTKKLGKIDKNNIQKIYDTYNLMGFIRNKNKIDMDEFIFDDKNNKLLLTHSEKDWIKAHPVITYSEIDWKPLSIIEDGKMNGILGEYLNLIEQATGITFKYLPSTSWPDVLRLFKEGKIDMLPSNPQYLNLGLISDIYKTYPMVIVTGKEFKYIGSLNDLQDNIIAVPKDYTNYNYIKTNYPQLKLKITKDIPEALLLVEEGEADAFVGHIATSLYYRSQLHLADLKISGRTKHKFVHSYLIRDEYPELHSIINKAIASITQLEKAKIDSNWIDKVVEEKVDYLLIFEIIGFSIILIVLFMYRNRQLYKYNVNLARSNRIIIEKDNNLQALNSTLAERVNAATNEMRRAYSIAKIGSWNVQIKENIVTWSDEIYDMLGIDKNTNPVLTVEDTLNTTHPEDIEKVQAAYADHIKNNIPYFISHRVILKDGSIKYVEKIGALSYDEEGNPAVSRGTVQDITEQTLTSIALKKKDEQLLQQSRLAQMGEMISMIAHQWRQPLTAISATTNNLRFKMMVDTIDKKLFEEEIGLIEKYSHHLSKTIDDFRGFFKEDKVKEITTLQIIVNSTLDIVKKSVENKNIKISTNLTCGLEFATYVNEVRQVVLNLIKNAEDVLIERKIKNPQITIETRCKDNEYMLIVKDNAGGISKEIKDKIFDPYFSTKLEKEGTGLGLYMSKTMIEEHCGGVLHVENDKYGAVFTVKLGANIIKI
jgi:PAS domain S-box-containing protein